MKKSMEWLHARKAAGERIVVLTCYDAPTARWEERAGVDILLVGDSVGTNVLGYQNEREVTLADIVHHVGAVRRAAESGYVLADMPYHTYETPEQALETAAALVAAGTDGVKFEGHHPEVLAALVAAGYEVCCHLGLNPQTEEKHGLRAKSAVAAAQLLREALDLQEKGASLLVLELVPQEVGRAVSERLRIPTIGIGAGNGTDAQVLIVQDMLGVNEFRLRHVTRYAELTPLAVDAITRYAGDVRAGLFPPEENVRHLAPEELAALEEMLAGE